MSNIFVPSSRVPLKKQMRKTDEKVLSRQLRKYIKYILIIILYL